MKDELGAKIMTEFAALRLRTCITIQQLTTMKMKKQKAQKNVS